MVTLDVVPSADIFDRSSWETVRFGDVVRNVNETERDPETAGFERYVGLEHIDPESLHIKRWGFVAEGTSFTRVFRKGQVLFGKRRAYQRKAAVAEWDGICSGDILVFEPKDDRLLLELLPFIVQSDSFVNHALGTSAGSLSPRTRWQDLAKYGLALPTKDDQQRIMEVLWAAEKSMRSLDQAISEQERIRALLVDEFVGGSLDVRRAHDRTNAKTQAWEHAYLGELLQICQYGLSTRGGDRGNAALLRMTNLSEGRVTNDDLQWVQLSPSELAKYQLEPGDVLFNRTNSWELVGKAGLYSLSGVHAFASYLIRLRVKPDLIRPEFLNMFLASAFGQSQLLRLRTQGVSQSNINAASLKRIKVPLPSLKQQDAFLSHLDALDQAHRALVSHRNRTAGLKRELLSRFLSVR